MKKRLQRDDADDQTDVAVCWQWVEAEVEGWQEGKGEGWESGSCHSHCCCCYCHHLRAIVVDRGDGRHWSKCKSSDFLSSILLISGFFLSQIVLLQGLMLHQLLGPLHGRWCYGIGALAVITLVVPKIVHTGRKLRKPELLLCSLSVLFIVQFTW